MLHELAPGLTLVERGWLHGNTIVVHETRDDFALVDSGYMTGVDELASITASVSGYELDELTEIHLTHVHSDHAGGVADLVERSGARVHGHGDAIRLVDEWNPRSLWLDGSGQHMPRFRIDESLSAGDEVRLGSRDWRIHWIPGHAVGGIGFEAPDLHMLISGDALWENGFGLLNPWVDGPQVFELTELALDTIAALDLAVVIPGHGPPVSDVSGALERARSRLAHLRTRPDRLRAQMVRNYLGFAMLAHGKPDREHATRLAERAARAHPPLEGDTTQLSPEDIAEQAVVAVLGS